MELCVCVCVCVCVCKFVLNHFFNIKIENVSISGISNGTYLRRLLQAILGLFFMWICLVLAILASAYLLVKAGRPMSWYNHSVNVFWLFVAPAMAAAITGLMLLQKFLHKVSKTIRK